MDEDVTIIVSLIIVVVVLFSFFVTCTPLGRAMFNKRVEYIKKIDDDTSYRTQKQVEDSCRAMIASYTSDKLTYEQFKENDIPEKQEWAEQAKMRANKTAASYNEYVLKNSYVWEGNVPKDILERLEYLE